MNRKQRRDRKTVRSIDNDRAMDRGRPFLHTDDSKSFLDLGRTFAIVFHFHFNDAIQDVNLHGNGGGLGVFDRIRQRLGNVLINHFPLDRRNDIQIPFTYERKIPQ